MANIELEIPASVLSQWSAFALGTVRPFGTGLINKTLLVSTPTSSAVFQRLHPVFAGTVNHDIDAVTTHLARQGLTTPRVIPSDTGALFALDPQSLRPWRALTLVAGRSVDALSDQTMAFQAGALVARFHTGVADLQYQYQHVRAGVHDTAKHSATLVSALAAHPTHRLFGDVNALAGALLPASSALPAFDALPLRHSHGDLKISNLLFDAHGVGVCLVDLDTLGMMAWPHEMGDALRSWTNRHGEDVADAHIDTAIFTAAVQGYAQHARGLITPAEYALWVDGMIAICVELAARFLADALNESYFGYDAQRFPARGEHNLLRARGQWALAQDAQARRAALVAIVARAFA